MSKFRWPRPYRSFKRANARRHELIAKEHAAVPEEEKSLQYDEHPGLRERHAAIRERALTVEERAELDMLSGLVDLYVHQKHPLPVENLEGLEARIREIQAEIEKGEG